MGAETLSTNPLASLDSVKGVTRSAVWLLCGPPTTPFSTKGWNTGVWEVVRMQRHRVLTLAGGPPGWLGVSCMVHPGWCSHVTFWELGQGVVIFMMPCPGFPFLSRGSCRHMRCLEQIPSAQLKNGSGNLEHYIYISRKVIRKVII